VDGIEAHSVERGPVSRRVGDPVKTGDLAKLIL